MEPMASKFSVHGRDDTGAHVVVNNALVETAAPEQVTFVAYTCTSYVVLADSPVMAYGEEALLLAVVQPDPLPLIRYCTV